MNRHLYIIKKGACRMGIRAIGACAMGACLLSVGLLSSCKTYQTYQRPTLHTDSLYGSTEITDTSSVASLHWRQLFTDAHLQMLVEEGLASNADLAKARLKVTEAEASLRASHLAYLPSLTAAPQGNISTYDWGTPSKTYNLAANAEWEIDIFGKLSNQERLSKATVGEYHAYQQAVKTELIATIANSYYNLLKLDEQLHISKQNLEIMKETVRALRVKMNVGESTEAAVTQALASQLDVEHSIATIQNNIHTQENAICVLLGRNISAITRGQIANQHFPDTLKAGIPLQLLDNRPDVRQAEYTLMEAYYQTNIARAAFYPSLTLSGSAGWTNSSGMIIANPGKWLLSAIGSVSQSIFSKGQNTAKLKIAKAQQQEAQISFQQLLVKAGSEVNNALTGWQNTRERILIDADRITQLEKTVMATRQLMLHSENANYLEILTAQQSLLQAELTAVDDRYEQIQSIINLYHALGGGEE